jgi:hypothetical protein
MSNKYFYALKPVRIGGKDIEPYKSMLIMRADVNEIMALRESGVVKLTQDRIVPVVGGADKVAASPEIIALHKKARDKKAALAPVEGDLP